MAETKDSSEPLAWEAEYNLESSARCPACRAEITTIQVVRLLRARVNFTSTLPRRGHIAACPSCKCVLSAELSSL